MFRGRQVVQNEVIARRMRRFLQTLGAEQWREPRTVATSYGKFLWGDDNKPLALEKILSRSRFYVGLSIGSDSHTLGDLTKRATLISDTLLLSHDHIGDYHQIDRASDSISPLPIPGSAGGTPIPRSVVAEMGRRSSEWHRDHLTEMYGIYCPSLDELGQWILDAAPLLEAGLVWYLPSYAIAKHRTTNGLMAPFGSVAPARAIDYLIQDGRAVDASGAEPVKSQLVRPILRIDLPFVEGVSLREFSKITIEEFPSYSAFRDFLRQRFLDMDAALTDVQSDRELLKLSLQIKDNVRSVRSEMETARRRKAVGATGAVIGSVGAILAAVYGPALAAAIAAVGASGGIWGIIHAATENSTRALREDTWYYVWVLAEKSNIDVL